MPQPARKQKSKSFLLLFFKDVGLSSLKRAEDFVVAAIGARRAA
jgi:hypothetical protein